MRYLLDQGANVDSRDRSKRTALYYAASKGDCETVQFLLQCGADVNSWEEIEGTPICAAASRAHEEVVEILLECKASVSVSYHGTLGSAMHCACFGGSLAIFKSILARGGNMSHMSKVSIVALSETTKERWSQSLKPGDRYESDYRFVKCTPLLVAAECCNYDILRLCWTPSFGKMPGHESVSVNDACWEYVQVNDSSQPLSARASAVRSSSFAQYASGLSNPSSKASSSSAWSFMGFARPVVDQPSSTLLMWAAGSLKINLVNHLLRAGASVDLEDASGRSALHYAASPFESTQFDSVGECVQKAGGVNHLSHSVWPVPSE